MRYREFIKESGDRYDDMEWGDAEMMDEPDEDNDGFIIDMVSGGYSASYEQKYVGRFGSATAAAEAIRDKAGPGMFPNIWFVDDHGGMELFYEDADSETFSGTRNMGNGEQELMAARGQLPRAQQRIRKHKLR